MKILLFGATGYIGNKLAKYLLSKGCYIANVGRRESNVLGVINYSIDEPVDNIIDSFLPDKIIYLTACFDNDNVNDIVNINIRLPLLILKKLESKENIEFAYIGSYWQFGNKSKPDVPIDLYSSSKKAVSLFLDYYNEYTNIVCKEIVLHGTYGESDGRGKLLEYLINSAKSNKEIELTEGKQKLNLVHVDDICINLEKIINEYNELKYQILAEKEYSPIEIVDIVKKYTNINASFGKLAYRDNELMEPRYDNKYKKIVVKDVLEDYISASFR